jgi:transposase
MGGGSGRRCRRRLQEGPEAGVGPGLHALRLAERRGAAKVDWSRAAVESSFVRARGGGETTGPSPGDRRKKGSRHVVGVDGDGIPRAATVSAAHAPDVTQRAGVVDAIPDVKGKPGRSRRRPDELYGDRGFDSEPHRAKRRRRGVKPKLARRKTEPGSGLGKVRWVVERFFSWRHRFGRRRVRTDKSEGIHDAFLKLACAEICLSFL